MDYWTGFALGFFGSVHCAGMCGPLILALPRGPGGRGFFMRRLVQSAGRVTTYAALGIVFGLCGRVLSFAGFQQAVSISLGVALLAGLLFSRRFAIGGPVMRIVGGLKSRMGRLLKSDGILSQGAFGMLNGFLPCGLVYVACAGATSTGTAGGGAIYMLAFGAGTIPMMLTIAFGERLIPSPVRLRLARAIPVSIVVLGVLLILRGLSLGIPYLSPDLAACCVEP